MPMQVLHILCNFGVERVVSPVSIVIDIVKLRYVSVIEGVVVKCPKDRSVS